MQNNIKRNIRRGSRSTNISDQRVSESIIVAIVSCYIVWPALLAAVVTDL